MTEGYETIVATRTEVLITERIRATRDSQKLGDLLERLGQLWISDLDRKIYAWVIYKDPKGYMYMKVYHPGGTRLRAILQVLSMVKMSCYVSGYNDKDDYLIMRIFS